MLLGPGLFSTFKHSFSGPGSGPFRSCCGSPGHVDIDAGPTYRHVPVMCGKCDHCRWVQMQTRANAIAMEIGEAGWARFVTLTIAPDAVTEAGEDRFLDIGLVQKFMKRVRANSERGHGSFKGLKDQKIRYICCGEWGTRKGRAHYHVVLWGDGKPPAWKAARRTHIPEWKMGHVNIRDGITGGVAHYLGAYMHKGEAGSYVHSASSNPGLGVDVARRIGRQHAIALRPADGYAITIVDGFRRRKAVLRGAAKREYVRAFAEAKGCAVVDLVPMCPDIMRPFLRRVDLWERERLQKAERKAALATAEGAAVYRAENMGEFQQLLKRSNAAAEYRARMARRRDDRLEAGIAMPPEPVQRRSRSWTGPPREIPLRDGDPPEKRAAIAALNERRKGLVVTHWF